MAVTTSRHYFNFSAALPQPIRSTGGPGFALAALVAEEQCTDANVEGHRTPHRPRLRISSIVAQRSGSQIIVDSADLAHPTRFERVTFAFGWQTLTPPDPGATHSNQSREWVVAKPRQQRNSVLH